MFDPFRFVECLDFARRSKSESDFVNSVVERFGPQTVAGAALFWSEYCRRKKARLPTDYQTLGAWCMQHLPEFPVPPEHSYVAPAVTPVIVPLFEATPASSAQQTSPSKATSTNSSEPPGTVESSLEVNLERRLPSISAVEGGKSDRSSSENSAKQPSFEEWLETTAAVEDRHAPGFQPRTILKGLAKGGFGIAAALLFHLLVLGVTAFSANSLGSLLGINGGIVFVAILVLFLVIPLGELLAFPMLLVGTVYGLWSLIFG